MIKAQKYVVTKHFQGVPKRDDYKLVEYELPPLQNREILVKAEWISVDPYLRVYNQFKEVPYDQFSYQVAIVQESKDPNYPVGTRIVTHAGWCDYSIVKDVSSTDPHQLIYKLPELQGLPNSLGIGAVGTSGATAYLAFLNICQPKPGETVVVTAAAGAVGSLVGQIAKIKGCKVIGFAGSDDKVKWLENELGFDKGLNYKTVDIAKALKEAAPNGVDCYFDNVGGDISALIMQQMNEHGRVCIVGGISVYNEDPNNMPKTAVLQPTIIFKQLKIEGFIIWAWFNQWPEVFTELVKWIKSGQIKAKEHVTEGFDKLFDAFVGMMAGENFGKAVVKV